MTWLTWALLSALFAGITAILAKVGVKEIDSNLATAIRTAVILAFTTAVVAVRGAWPAAISQRTWLFLVLSGLATGVSWLCYFRSLQLGNASQVAPIDKLSIIVAMVLAVAFLGEPTSWRHWLGGALMVAGAMIVAKA